MTELRLYDKAGNRTETVTDVVEADSALSDGRLRHDFKKGGVLRASVIDAAPAAPVPSWKLLKEWTFDTGAVPTEFAIYNGTPTSGNTVGGVYKSTNVRAAPGELLVVGDGKNGGGLQTMLYRTYGRWEVRCRMEPGAGAGPALILWPSSDNWPKDGEIDFMESPDATHQKAYLTNHWGDTYATKQNHSVVLPLDVTAWQTYAVEWEQGVIRKYVNGTLVDTQTGTPGVEIPNKPMGMTIQVDGPNGWIPPRNALSPAEMALHVDYVKVYTR